MPLGDPHLGLGALLGLGGSTPGGLQRHLQGVSPPRQLPAVMNAVSRLRFPLPGYPGAPLSSPLYWISPHGRERSPPIPSSPPARLTDAVSPLIAS